MDIQVQQANLHTDLDRIIRQVEFMLNELSDNPGHVLRIGKIVKDIQAMNEHYFSFVALDNEDNIHGIANILESVSIYANGKYGVITEFYVSKKVRHKGIGRQLLETAYQLAEEKEWDRLEVSVPLTPKGIHSVEFYEKMGFSHSGPKMERRIEEVGSR
ncbi:MAG: N-acetyltransferase family protein [Bacteroidota bacterium]